MAEDPTKPEGGSYEEASAAQSKRAGSGGIGLDHQQGPAASDRTRYAEVDRGLRASGGLQSAGQEQAESVRESTQQPVEDPFYTFVLTPEGEFTPVTEELFATGDDMPWGPDQGEDANKGLEGIEIIWADQSTPTFINAADLLKDFDSDTHDYWSLVLNVSSGKFDKVVTNYDATEDIFEDDGGSPPKQTKYRFRLVTQGLDAEGDPITTPISMYGQYREVTTCINGEPFQRLTKVT